METELAIKPQDDGIRYQTRVEISVTTANFYFSLESRPLLVFLDGRVDLEQRRWQRTKSYDHSYGKEDTES
jgi:hypothetical protein